MLRYRAGEDNPPVMRESVAAYSAVVPAQAGTHNPREKFGEDSQSGTATDPIERSRGMGPRERGDDTEG